MVTETTIKPSSHNYDLDFWNYILYSLELTMNICFIVAYPIVTYICMYQKTLHVNFRILLQLANSGYLLSNLQRSILIIQRFCCIGNANTDFVLSLTYLLFFGGYLFTGSWFALVVERVYASWRSSSYEKKCKSVMDTSIIGFLGILPAIVVTLLKYINIGATFDYILTASEFVIDILTAAALFYIFYYNKKVYDGRHDNSLALSGRYQLTENIRATRYIIPVAICDFIGRLIVAGLICYSVFFTDIPLGTDTSHLSHAYDLNSATRRVFFGCWLIFRNEGIFPQRRSNTIMVDTVGHREKHFEDLRKQWE